MHSQRLLLRLLGFRPTDKVRLTPMVAPFAAAFFSVLVIVAENPSTGIRWANLLVPLLIALPLTHALWILSGFISRDPDHRGLITLFVLLQLLFFAYLAEGLTNLAAVFGLPPQGVVIATMLSLTCLLLLWSVRTRVSLLPLSHFLAISTAILLLFTGARAGLHLTASPEQDVETFAFSVSGSSALTSFDRNAEAGPDPDIFLIILDGYAGPGVLRDTYDLDISPFVDSLTSMGYRVPLSSRANYVQTFASLASMMDWRYLHEEMLEARNEREAISRVLGRLEDNNTTRLLESRGYHYVHFRSSYPPLNNNRRADTHFPAYRLTDLESMWFQTTALPVFLALMCSKIECGRGGLGFVPETPEVVRARLRQIADLPVEGPPLFAFAHLLLPHEPFVLREDCSVRPAVLPREVTPENEAEVLAAYREQVACLNDMLLPLARTLATERSRPAVVLFQSDHGFGRLGIGWGHTLDEAGRSRVDDRTSVFAAYYVPSDIMVDIYDDITPINAFRSIFSSVFSLDLDLLPDSTHWASYVDPLAFETFSP